MIAKGRLDVGPRKGKRRAPVAVPATDPKAERLARRLALAHWVERRIEAGDLAGYAEAARALGVTRARLSQVLDTMGMQVDEREAVLLHDSQSINPLRVPIG